MKVTGNLDILYFTFQFVKLYLILQIELTVRSFLVELFKSTLFNKNDNAVHLNPTNPTFRI